MGFLQRLFAKVEGKAPLLDVVNDLSSAGVQAALRAAKNCTASLRSQGHSIAPEHTQRILDECIFLCMHLVEREASGMLSKRTQDMFLPTFMNVILWMRFKSQAPDWSDEQCEREAGALMSTFDSVNAQYAHTRLDAPKDERDLPEALVYQFGRRVVAATELDPADPQALLTCMSSMRGIMQDMQPTQHFGRIVQVQ